MVSSICNSYITSEESHTVTIKNGVDYHEYVYNHFILCPKCYQNVKYQLEIAGTPIEGPEDRDDIDWPRSLTPSCFQPKNRKNA